MKERKKHQKITKTELDLVHLLTERGVKSQEIAKIARIGAGTVHYLKRAKTIEEYERLRGRKDKKPQPAPAEEVKMQAVEQALTGIELTSLLTRIAVAIERLADATQTKEDNKKGWRIR